MLSRSEKFPFGEMSRYHCLALLTTLSILTSSAEAGTIGINWGRNSSSPLPPHKVVALLKANNVGKVRIFDANPYALEALSGSNIDVTVGVPNFMLKELNSSLKAATEFVKNNVTRFVSSNGGKVKIEYIAIGDDPFLQSYNGQFVSFVVGAATNLQTALKKANLANRVTIIVPCSHDAFQSENSLPSKGHFRPELNSTMVKLLTFLTKHGSPFCVTISPFHLLYQKKNTSLEFALFKGTKHHVKDNHTIYNNTFDLSYDTVVSALSTIGFPEMDIVVGQIGWPTDGATNANTSTAEMFMKALLKHIHSISGTPLRPHRPPKEIYILGLLDEDERSIVDGSFERHWGIFTFDGQAKYHVDLGQGSKNLRNAQSVEYLLDKWCVVNNNKDMANASAVAAEACSTADCSDLAPGGSCFNLSFPANVSYAFNSYYQMHDQSPGSCDFGGLGLVTTVDPSLDNCRFYVQLRTSPASSLEDLSYLSCWILLLKALVWFEMLGSNLCK